jgi:hypothetical protein
MSQALAELPVYVAVIVLPLVVTVKLDSEVETMVRLDGAADNVFLLANVTVPTTAALLLVLPLK